MEHKRVNFHTLGCKLNFSETSTIAREFDKGGFVRVAPDAATDIAVINSCSVTEHADKKCRNIIRKIHRRNPDAVIAVTGCYAQLKPNEIAAIDGVDIVLSNNDKGDIYKRVVELLAGRGGIVSSCHVEDLTRFFAAFSSGDRTRLEFDIPSRGIIGLRSNMLTATAGEAIMTHRLKDFEPWVGDIEMRTNGSIIASETGTAYAYSIDKLQDRGRFFISPMDQVYCGQVVGEHTRSNDITVNVTKAKQLTNMRASGSDDKASIAPPIVFSLEEALEYIKEDEYVELTPKAMRLRKILLSEVDRKRAAK